jgi:hypothetical protein
MPAAAPIAQGFADDPVGTERTMQATGPAMFVEVAGVEYESRDFCYTDDALTLSDSWSVTLPCPDGYATGLDGRRVHISTFKEGALVKLREADPAVESGMKMPRLVGRLTSISDRNDPQSGFVVTLSGYDLGWHLTTGCGEVFQNYRGVKWNQWLNRVVLNAANGWGFAGVRTGNLENVRTKIGTRAAINAAQFRGVRDDGTPNYGAIQPRFQIEIGQSVGPIIIDTAKWERRLVNVSADGWLQIFSPRTSASKALYTFDHHAADKDSIYPRNNVFNSSLTRSADGLYTVTQCWTSIVNRPLNEDTDNPNRGQYHGQYVDSAALPFTRRNTFSDSNQIGRRRAEVRAKWMHDRGVFDSWEYTFTTQGHSQNGIPFVSDTIASLNDSIRGIRGLFYVQRVKPVRRLASAGISTGAGTYAEITLKKPDLLSA